MGKDGKMGKAFSQAYDIHSKNQKISVLIHKCKALLSCLTPIFLNLLSLLRIYLIVILEAIYNSDIEGCAICRITILALIFHMIDSENAPSQTGFIKDA